MNELETLIKVHLKTALGPDGVEGDAQALAFVAKKTADFYCQVLAWTKRIRNVRVPECFRPLLPEVAKLPTDIIEKTRTWGKRVQEGVNEARMIPKGEKRVLTIALSFEVHVSDEYHRLMKQVCWDCFGLKVNDN